jgi:carbohydrate-binding DOMON domain-containing protein
MIKKAKINRLNMRLDPAHSGNKKNPGYYLYREMKQKVFYFYFVGFRAIKAIKSL